MCYNVQQMGDKIRRQAERQFGLTSFDVSQMEFRFFHVSGFDHPSLLVVKWREGPEMVAMSWGLIPFWVKTREDANRIRQQTLNARCETAYTKPSYRHLMGSKRCVIPVNGFYESRDIKGKKYPHFIHAPGEDVCWLGGIWDQWVDQQTGEVTESFSILTTNANPFVAVIHNIKLRMPLILKPENLITWLDPSTPQDEINKLLQPYTDTLEAHTVSKMVNQKKVNNNFEGISNPYIYPEMAFFP